jgi:radical SAM superfamily enzyme YgiQ (UPF0313 family)
VVERAADGGEWGRGVKKRILLVSPHADNEALWVTGDEELRGQAMNNFVPLGLATIAALTAPEAFEVQIWDELVHGRLDSTGCAQLPWRPDLVGVTGYKAHIERCVQVARIFRAQGITVAIGGPGVSCSPSEYRPHFDILFIGEAEETWPQFLRDWQAGAPQAEYRQIEKLDLATSPMPRWDSIAPELSKYAFGGVQTTRGCPFDCEFCDVIYLYGRRARHKPVECVLEEVQTLARLGMTNLFFADDEFIGDLKYAKDLLRALGPLNNTFAYPLTYSTQLTMNLSRDDELLELMADANFDLVFIGIETPNKNSLRETHKMQNVRDDLVADVRKILSYGISIRAGMIVGFDHDGPDIFDAVYDFIQAACLPSLAINMLKAPLGTRLWSRLRLEGRVISLASLAGKGHPRTYTNILPKRMTRAELVAGYGRLLERVNAWPAFRDRMMGFVSGLRRVPRVREEPLPLDTVRGLAARLGVTGAEAQIVEEIFEHTAARAPFLMRRMKRLIVQHSAYQRTLGRLLDQIERQLEIELQPDIAFAPDDRAIPTPPAFRKAFNRMFPDVHRRVYLNLADKRRVPAALAEVFVDFLVRWGEGSALEPYHLEYLKELCDRTCARLNNVAPETFVPVDDPTAEVPDVKRTRLHEDVLRTVDQELARFVHERPAAPPLP